MSRDEICHKISFSFCRPSDKPKIQKMFTNSELVYLDAGHWVHAEKPEEFMKLVLNFLNQA